MEIEKDFDLTKLNTFGVSAKARFFVEVNSEKELMELFELPEFKENEKLFLGRGSNVLFTRDFLGMVILNKIKGIEVLEAPTFEEVGVPTEGVGKDSVLIKAFGGEVWDDFVKFAADRGYWGVENLAGIPGTVGATPVQNIGAYGAEVKDVIFSVETYDVLNGKKRTFSNEECHFGYRDSIFKRELKEKYFISAVVFKLNKKEDENLRYKTLKEYIKKNNLTIKSPKDISRAVAEIRREKLPDPKVFGNAGSFFKNVFVSREKFEELSKKYPDIPSFTEEKKNTSPPTPLLVKERGESRIKIPTGWLIEQSGWKGKALGRAGVHEHQALILVNLGGATSSEIKNLSDRIRADVSQKFGLTIEPEVNLI